MTSILKVDTIQTTSGTSLVTTDSSTTTIKNPNGTTGLTIDTNGVVATPTRPAFFAYRQAATEGLNGTLVFNNTKSNVGNHYSTSTGKFTAPITGLYQFNFVGMSAGDTSGNRLGAGNNAYATLYNETTSLSLARGYASYPSTTSYANLSFSAMVPLAINDVIRIDIGANYAYSDASGIYLTFSGYLVS